MASQKHIAPSVQDLFAAALDVPTDRRPAFLASACADSPATLRVLEALLAEHERAGSFLQAPLLAYAPGTEPTLPEFPGRAAAGDLTHPRFAPQQLIQGRFEVVRFLARGGMGEVYEVRDQFLQGASVALKIVRPEIAADAASSQRFEQEVLSARTVNHPNLCPIYEIFRCATPPPPFLFLTMKLLRGETLAERLKSPQPVSPEDKSAICTHLVRGVGAMHAAGVIHRDLKPNNIMLERDGPCLNVSIMDFGLARLHEAEVTVARSGLAGTPGYFAPELLRGQRPTDATDLYALGIVLHLLFTGERPLDDPQTLGVRPAPSLRRASSSPALQHAVEDLLALDPETRRRAFAALHASADSLHTATLRSPRPLTRRGFLVTAGASACALAGGLAWRHQQLYDWMHPLPAKRFVAVLNWPPTRDPRLRPMISGLLDSIANELARAEAYDRNFFITTPRQTADLTTPKDLLDTTESLGTNLVLAASATLQHNNTLRVALRILDPATPRTLRTEDIHLALQQVFSLPQRAVHIAAELLDVNHYQPDDNRNTPGTNNPEALAAFQQAELLRKQDNDTGLRQAIEKYNQAVELDPHFAHAQSSLGWAYIRLYGLSGDAAALSLGRENCESAVALDPNLVAAHVGLALALEQMGDRNAASHEMINALELDPSNPHTLTQQAQFYVDSGQYAKAEDTFSRVLKLRPNFWLAHNNFGSLLDDEGKYDQALMEFRKANIAAPRSALVYSNIGLVSLQTGNIDEAIAAAQKSLSLIPNEFAALVLAEACRIRRRFPDAIMYAQQSVQLNSAFPPTWLELGDVLSAAGKPARDIVTAYKHGVGAAEAEVRTEPKYGPGWMLLAFLRIKSGDTDGAPALLAKAASLNADDLTSQLLKVRALEILGKRDDCLALIQACVRRGATLFQFQNMPDLEKVRADPRYLQLFKSAPPASRAS